VAGDRAFRLRRDDGDGFLTRRDGRFQQNRALSSIRCRYVPGISSQGHGPPAEGGGGWADFHKFTIGL
jgi:hypothetical protein